MSMFDDFEDDDLTDEITHGGKLPKGGAGRIFTTRSSPRTNVAADSGLNGRCTAGLRQPVRPDCGQ